MAKIDEALEYIQQQGISASFAIGYMRRDLTRERFVQILKHLGFSDKEIFDYYPKGKAIDFKRQTILRDLCIGLMELKQNEDVESINKIDLLALFAAVKKSKPKSISTVDDAWAVVAQNPRLITEVRNNYNENIKGKGLTLFRDDRDITCPLFLNLITEVLDLVFIGENNSYMRANNLKFAAQVIGRPILVVNADNVGGALNCTYYPCWATEVQITCAVSEEGKVCKITDQNLISLNDVFVIAKTGVHFFGPPSFQNNKGR